LIEGIATAGAFAVLKGAGKSALRHLLGEKQWRAVQRVIEGALSDTLQGFEERLDPDVAAALWSLFSNYFADEQVADSSPASFTQKKCRFAGRTLDGGGWARHPYRYRHGPRKPTRLTAANRDPGRRERDTRGVTQAGERPPRPRVRVEGHPQATRRTWAESRDLREGKAGPLAPTRRWIVERTNSWHNAHKKRVWCT
jgi:hypothetical protein